MCIIFIDTFPRNWYRGKNSTFLINERGQHESKGNKDLIFEGNAPIKCWKSKCVFELKKSRGSGCPNYSLNKS